MHVIAIGHDKKIFDTTSRPYARQLLYAQHLTQLSIFIPTQETYRRVEGSRLTVIPVEAASPLIRFLRLFWHILKLAKKSKSVQPTLLTVQSPFEFGLIGLVVRWCTGVSLEIQVHGDFYSREYWRQESWGNRVRYRLGLFVLRRASGVRVVSKRIATSLCARGVARSRIVVLPITTSLTAFQTAHPRPLWPEQAGVIILSVARFSKEKNLPLLIQAFAKVHAHYPETRLVLVGEGAEETVLRMQVAALWPTAAPVLFYPWQSDVASVMKAADIFALTSDYEGYAMVLAEAMAAGLAIVTTGVGCVGEICIKDKHALVIEPKDESGLVSVLKQLVSNEALRQHLCEQNRQAATTLERASQGYDDRLITGWKRLIG